MSRQVSIAKLPLTIAAGALLVALFECGTDPFAGQLYPAGAVPSSDAYGTDLTCLEQPCGNATFAIWNPDGSDLAQASYCQGGTVYWLCAVGRSSYGYGAYTCTDPASSGWTFGGCGSVAVDAGADALTFDAGIEQ